MNKIFSAIFLTGFIFAANICSAEPVRICDYGVDGFVNRYNQIAREPSVNYDIAIKERPQNFGSIDVNGKTYVVYMVGCGSEGSGIILNFMTTPDGYISRILIFLKKTSEVAKTAGAVNAAALIAAGMSPKEVLDFLEVLGKNNFNAYYWSSSLQRYIICELDESNNEVACVRMSAAVK